MPLHAISREEEFCKLLIHVGAVKFGVFTLSGGKLSPYYVDLRLIPSFPDAFNKSVEILAQMAKTSIGLEKIDRIAGIPTAGVPFASALSYSLRKPFLYTRKGVKMHGRERRVEGMLAPGDRVLIVDDVITTGKNVSEAVEAITAEGAVVENTIFLIDREEGGAIRFRRKGIKTHSFMTISEVAKHLLEMDAIDKEQYDQIILQIKGQNIVEPA